MKIYKFKDLSEREKHPHSLQIALENKIWCASPESLNDKDEFKYELEYNPTAKTVTLLAQILQEFGENKQLPPVFSANHVIQNGQLAEIAKPIISKMIKKARAEVGITSFSMENTGQHLWDEYGGKGNGVCIEIEISDSLVNEIYHPVKYVPKKIFHVDSFFEAALNINIEVMRKNMFLTKSKDWEIEKEIRFLGKEQNCGWFIDGSITELVFGPKVSQKTMAYFQNEVSKYRINNRFNIKQLSRL